MRASPFMVAGWGYGVSSGCQYFSFFKILVNLLRSDIESLLTRLSACVQTVYRTVCTDTRFRFKSYTLNFQNKKHPHEPYPLK